MPTPGHDTTACALTWTLHNLALNPECQARARNEVNAMIGDREELEWWVHHLSPDCQATFNKIKICCNKIYSMTHLYRKCQKGHV